MWPLRLSAVSVVVEDSCADYYSTYNGKRREGGEEKRKEEKWEDEQKKREAEEKKKNSKWKKNSERSLSLSFFFFFPLDSDAYDHCMTAVKFFEEISEYLPLSSFFLSLSLLSFFSFSDSDANNNCKHMRKFQEISF